MSQRQADGRLWGDGRAAAEVWALGLAAGRPWGECPAEAPGQPRGEPCKGAGPELSGSNETPPEAGVTDAVILTCLRHIVQAEIANVYHQAWEGRARSDEQRPERSGFWTIPCPVSLRHPLPPLLGGPQLTRSDSQGLLHSLPQAWEDATQEADRHHQAGQLTHSMALELRQLRMGLREPGDWATCQGHQPECPRAGPHTWKGQAGPTIVLTKA